MTEKEQEDVRERLDEIYEAIKVLNGGLVSQKGVMEKLERLMGILGERQDNLQKRMDEMDTSSKSVMTNPELIDELESHSAQVTSLALQTEKLAKLRSEGKVSDAIYAELYGDIRKKVEDARSERKRLSESARSRIKEVNSEVGELKYRFERLEVRRLLDFVSAEKYSASKDELLKKIGENDEAMILISKLIAALEEAFEKIDAYMPEPPEEQKEESRRPQSVPLGRDPKPFRPVQKDLRPPPIPAIPQALPKETAAREERKAVEELICPKCKGANQKGAVFCIECGARMGPSVSGQEKKALDTAVKVEVKEDVKKEAAKEAPIRMRERFKPILGIKKCPKCGLENLSVASYCYHCNASLSNNNEGNVPPNQS